MKTFWKYWSKALGEKAFRTTGDSDKVAAVRTVIVLIYMITNMFIIAGVIHHW